MIDLSGMVYGTLELYTEEIWESMFTIKLRGVSVTGSAGHGGADYVTRIHLNYNVMEDAGFSGLDRNDVFFNPGSADCILWCYDNQFHVLGNGVTRGLSAAGEFTTSQGGYFAVKINPADIFGEHG